MVKGGRSSMKKGREREMGKGREVAHRLTREERKVEVHPCSPLLYRTHVRKRQIAGYEPKEFHGYPH